MKQYSQRKTFLTGFIAVITLLGIVAYLQAFRGFEPCALCILQRYALIFLGMVFFVGTLIRFNTFGLFCTSLLALAFSALGATLAGRQVWLQHLPPDQTTGCGASLEYMMQVLPLKDVARKIFEGSTECSQVGLAFWNVSLAGWSLACFSLFIVFSLWQLYSVFATKTARYS